MTTRCGSCAIIGAPNAGKSTLINQLVGGKISIVSRKVQTTRCRITGIFTEQETQIILVDTPGLFDPKRPLEKAIVEEAWRAIDDVDVILLMIDAATQNVPPDFTIPDQVMKRRRPDQTLMLALNKVDLVHPKEKLLALASAYQTHLNIDKIFMISAHKGQGMGDMIDAIAPVMAPGPWLYPEDQITNLPLKLLAAEATREALFNRLHQELPYHLMVETEIFEEQDKNSVRIEQNIIVGRDNHKGIVIGKGGQTLKQIGIEARHALEDLFERRVHLFLRVSVDENWDRNAERLRNSGLSL